MTNNHATKQELTDAATLPIVNPSDHDWTRNLYLMWAGSYASERVYIWANSFDDAFEHLTEWLDDNAPGCLTSFTTADYEAAAEELGLVWTADYEDDDTTKIAELVEADHTGIGHTTLKHGTHIASYEWGGDDVTDSDEIAAVKARCSSDKWAYGNGLPGCLHDNQSGPYETAEEAAKEAGNFLELTEEETAELIADHIVYFHGDRAHEVGAGLVELFEVSPDWSCE